MEQFEARIIIIEKITHDVLRIVTEKPSDYTFRPGQATEVGINNADWKKELRPFTFTSLPDDDHLEFTIKTYPSHKGMTNELLTLKPNDELIIGESWGAIGYTGEGTFIAGGAGVTPFISIFRYLYSNNKIGNNKLIFANKTKDDIINADEFAKMLGNNFINILSNEKSNNYFQGYITEGFLKNSGADLKQYFYVCGPDLMMKSIEKQLSNLGVSPTAIIKEKF